MKVDVLLGLQWGDEGKGKVVDVLTPRYDVVARFRVDRMPDIHSSSKAEVCAPFHSVWNIPGRQGEYHR